METWFEMTLYFTVFCVVVFFGQKLFSLLFEEDDNENND